MQNIDSDLSTLSVQECLVPVREQLGHPHWFAIWPALTRPDPVCAVDCREPCAPRPQQAAPSKRPRRFAKRKRPRRFARRKRLDRCRVGTRGPFDPACQARRQRRPAVPGRAGPGHASRPSASRCEGSAMQNHDPGRTPRDGQWHAKPSIRSARHGVVVTTASECWAERPLGWTGISKFLSKQLIVHRTNQWPGLI